MKLYIVRHGSAVPSGTAGVAEDDRPLTPEGIGKLEKASRALTALGVIPELILTSPLPRASQTAEIVREALGGGIEIKPVPGLSPTGSRPAVYSEIQQHEKLTSLMLVGHQPSLGEIAGEIAWGSAASSLELKKAGICCLELEKLCPVPSGTLLWLLTPGILRRLAKKDGRQPTTPDSA